MTVTLKSDAGTLVTVPEALAEVLAAQGWKAVSGENAASQGETAKEAAAVDSDATADSAVDTAADTVADPADDTAAAASTKKPASSRSKAKQ